MTTCTAKSVAEAPVFVDTGYLVALLNKRDGLHGQAKKLALLIEKDGRRLLTTDGVLFELANFFASSPLRASTMGAIQKIRAASGWLVERMTEQLVERAETRYAAHADKAWSLTDCLSMESMVKHGALEAATPDRHFTQAGFRILMKTSS